MGAIHTVSIRGLYRIAIIVQRYFGLWDGYLVSQACEISGVITKKGLS